MQQIDEAYFIAKQDRLLKAIDKVKAVLADYSERAKTVTNRPWTDEDFKQFPNWNNYHDLEDRLTARLWENWSDYQDWHFDKFGWVAYG